MMLGWAKSGFIYLTSIVVWGVFVSPAGATLDLLTSLGLQEQYTDNLFFNNSNKVDDFGTFIMPRVGLAYQDKNVVLAGAYTGVAQFYAKNGGADRYSQNFNIFMDFPFLNRQFKRLTVRFIERLAFSPSLPAFTFDNPNLTGVGGVILSGFGAGGIGGFGGQGNLAGGSGSGATNFGGVGSGSFGGTGSTNFGGLQSTNFGSGGLGGVGGGVSNQGVFTQRSDAFANIAGVQLIYAWTPRLSNSVTYLNRIIKFTDNTNFVDGVSNSVQSRISYALSPRTSVNAAYAVNITGFPGTNANTLVTHNITGGASYILTQDISIFGNIGTALTQNAPGALRASGGIRMVAQLTAYSLYYTRFVGTGAGVAALATIGENVTAQITRQLSAKSTGFLLGGYGKTKALAGPSNVVDIETYQGGVGMNYLFLPWLSGNLNYRYIKQNVGGSVGIAADVHQVNVLFTVIGPIIRLMN